MRNATLQHRRASGNAVSRGPARRGRPAAAVAFYLPKNLDMQQALPADLRRYEDCARYLVHLIIYGRSGWRVDGRGFVRLKAEYLRNAIPQRVLPRLTTALARSGIIEIDRHYEKGKHAMGYRLGPLYRASPVMRIDCQDAALAEKIRRRRSTEFHTRATLPVHKHLRRQLTRLTIDERAAEATILATPRLAPDAAAHLATVAMIAAGHPDWCYSRWGRVFSTVTRLPRELRQHLRFDGRPLVNIDVRNSQPMFLGLLVKQYRLNGSRPVDPVAYQSTCHSSTDLLYLNSRRAGRGEERSRGDGGTGGVITMCIPTDIAAQSGMDSEVTSANYSLGADEQKYLDLCQAGVFYEHLQRLAGMGRIDRDAFKPMVFAELFGPRNRHLPTPIAAPFARAFPGVAAVVREVKRRNYRVLVRLLQHVESTVIVGGVCQRLMEQRPGVPCVTIHDSIMTTPAHVETVESVMRQTFADFGLYPRRFHRDGDYSRQTGAAA